MSKLKGKLNAHVILQKLFSDKAIRILVYSCLFFSFILSFDKAQKIISKRIERHDYQNIIHDLKELDTLYKKEIPIIVENKFALLFALNFIKDRPISYDESYLKKSTNDDMLCEKDFLYFGRQKQNIFICGKKVQLITVWTNKEISFSKSKF